MNRRDWPADFLFMRIATKICLIIKNSIVSFTQNHFTNPLNGRENGTLECGRVRKS